MKGTKAILTFFASNELLNTACIHVGVAVNVKNKTYRMGKEIIVYIPCTTSILILFQETNDGLSDS